MVPEFLMNKISLIAITGLSVSLGAYAALPTDAAPFELVVPNLKSGLGVTLEGLYLQPTNSDLDYITAASTINIGNIINNSTQVKSVDPDYNLGFRVGLGYTFADSGNDVQLSWTHFNHTDTDNFTAGDNTFITTPLGFRNYINAATTEAQRHEALFNTDTTIYEEGTVSSDATFKLDTVDLDVGQYIDIGTRLRMRMFAGLRFAQLENNQNTTYAEGSFFFTLTDYEYDFEEYAEYTDTYSESFDSKFTGIGPRVGVDSFYHLGNCFGIVAHAAVALLVGQTETSTNSVETRTQFVEFLTTPPDNFPFGEEDDTFITNNSLNANDSTRVVPVIDAKLGLNYSHVFDDGATFSLEGGYQVTQYIDAVDKLTTEAVAGENGLITQANRTTSSVGFNGPYLSLNYKY
jgi:hypothetical protein